MFKNVRLKLTAWYIVITMLFTILLSFAIYRQSKNILNEFNYQLHTKHLIAQQANLSSITSATDTELQRLRFGLFAVDIIVFCISGAAGYFLAGRTLKPLEKNMEEQKRFVTDASHEFRTPLTALKTSIEVNIRDKEFKSPVVQNLLQRNLYQIDKLQNLANSLLTLAQYQKTQKMQLSSLSLLAVLNDALSKIESLAEAKQITIHTAVKDVGIRGEKESLAELFTILLDNAIKYSHASTSITIQCSIAENNVNISVQDQGIGIAKKDIQHIFDRFYRSDVSRSHHAITGFGLGLSIAKRIVRAHKGEIHVESEIGKGTTFIIQLPKTS